MQEKIPWNELPLTMQDAIEVTRAFGVQYLWVNALCIIQDSPGNWSAEASKMADVYRCAFLTISAARCLDVCYGLGLLKKTDLYNYSLEVKRGLEDEPLYKRAWSLKERILSPEVLIFGSDDPYWECQANRLSRYSGPIPRSLCFRLPLNPSDSDWHIIVSDWTCRLMTRENDKLPALAGLVAVYGNAAKKTHFGGL